VAAPVLFDPGQILVEQLVMADLLAMALMVGLAGIILPRRRTAAARWSA
jgi:hypothetical protein